MKELYIIRHCQAEGQEPNAPLTELGRQQAERLATQLSSIPLDRIVSSPYVRAIKTIEPLAHQIQIPIHTDERLIERVLCNTNEPEWRDMLTIWNYAIQEENQVDRQPSASLLLFMNYKQVRQNMLHSSLTEI